MEIEKRILHTTEYFDVIQKGSMVGIEPIDVCVVVMPFQRDSSGLPKSIGVLKEYNPMREGNYSMTLVTGRTEDEDPDLLATAMREFKEESGYDVSDPERWCFLGFMTASKIVMQEHPCFAVDITDLEQTEKKQGDGSEAEAKSTFHIVSVKEALNTSDCFIPTLFMKIFKYIFNVNDFVQRNSDESETEMDINDIKTKLDAKILSIDGVNGSLVVDVDGTKTIEYSVSKMTDDIKNKIPTEFEGIKITTKEINGEPTAQTQES